MTWVLLFLDSVIPPPEMSSVLSNLLVWAIETAVVGIIAFFTFQRAIDGKFAAFDITLTKFQGVVKADMITMQAGLKADMVTMQTTLKADINTVASEVRDATRRISQLESGQDEWTRTLRGRTHDLAEKLAVVMLKVDRLERPHSDNN